MSTLLTMCSAQRRSKIWLNDYKILNSLQVTGTWLNLWQLTKSVSFLFTRAKLLTANRTTNLGGRAREERVKERGERERVYVREGEKKLQTKRPKCYCDPQSHWGAFGPLLFWGQLTLIIGQRLQWKRLDLSWHYGIGIRGSTELPQPEFIQPPRLY